MTLYEIKDNYLKLLQADIEDEQAFNDTLEAIEGELEDKADNIACLIKTVNYEAKAIKEEAKNLLERAKQKENTADRLKKYLFDTFKALNKDKLETSRNKLSIRKNPASVVLAEDFYHEEYVEEIKTYKADKKAIKEALQSGEVIQGARLEQSERLDVK